MYNSFASVNKLSGVIQQVVKLLFKTSSTEIWKKYYAYLTRCCAQGNAGSKRWRVNGSTATYAGIACNQTLATCPITNFIATLLNLQEAWTPDRPGNL